MIFFEKICSRLKNQADRSGVVYVVPFASKCSTLFFFLFISDRLDGFRLF